MNVTGRNVSAPYDGKTSFPIYKHISFDFMRKEKSFESPVYINCVSCAFPGLGTRSCAELPVLTLFVS